jgi:hypothetical protein
MHDFCAGYVFNMIERNEIWKQYMQVEEGEWELTGRSRLGRQQQDEVVTGAGSSKSGHGWRRQQVREAFDANSTSDRRPPGLLPCFQLPFMRPSCQQKGQSRQAGNPCQRDTRFTYGAPQLNRPPPPGRREHGQLPMRILVHGALQERKQRGSGSI